MQTDKSYPLPSPPLSSAKASAQENKTATLAMGCFWSPDALFGSLEGVVRTRVGYAGGSTESPSYRNLADHIETIQIDYDPARIGYHDLLHVFFSNHKPIAEPWKRQYTSAVFYHDEEQEKLLVQTKEEAAKRWKREMFTLACPFQAFYMAEDRHQKYKLQRQPELMNEFSHRYANFTDLIHSTAAARINGYLYGYGNQQELKNNLDSLGLSYVGQRILLDKTKNLKGVYPCAG